MAQQQNKRFIVDRDQNFGNFAGQVNNLMRRQQDDRVLEVLGYVEAQSNHVFSASNTLCWRRSYDYIRTLKVVLRLHMLKATDLIRLCDLGYSKTQLHNEGHINVQPSPQHNMPINTSGHLARNVVEARQVIGHFNTLINYYREEPQLNAIEVNTTGHLKGQMIIVDTAHNKIWYFIVSCSITRNQDRLIAARPGQAERVHKCFTSRPYFAVFLYNYVPEDGNLLQILELNNEPAGNEEFAEEDEYEEEEEEEEEDEIMRDLKRRTRNLEIV